MKSPNRLAFILLPLMMVLLVTRLAIQERAWLLIPLALVTGPVICYLVLRRDDTDF